MVGGNTLVGAVGVREGCFELLAEISLRLRKLREDEDTAVVPGTVGIEEVLSNPRDETFLRVGQTGVGERRRAWLAISAITSRSAISSGRDLLRALGSAGCDGDGLLDALGDLAFGFVGAFVIGVGSAEFCEESRGYCRFRFSFRDTSPYSYDGPAE